MNKGTKLRTALRVAVSIYTAFCVWQVAIGELGDMLGTKWLAIICSAVIVLSGIAVDIITTYFNNDYTVEGDTGTKITREMKKLREFESETVAEPADSEVSDGSK